MNAIIIDDEPRAIASLEMELREITPPITIVGTANSVKTGAELLQNITPDLLFLDIQMGDGLGFEIFDRISNTGNFKVVFTTAFDHYALEAIKHHAFDYLLKPIDPDELQKTISEIHKRTKDDVVGVQTEHVLKELSEKMSPDRKIVLYTADGIFLRKVSEIIHVQADGNYTKFFFSEGEKPMLISKTLKEFVEILVPLGFERIHHSHLINLSHLSSFHTKDGNYVVMSNKQMLPVSTRKKQALLERLKEGMH